MSANADQLRNELNPNGQMEEMFFSQIVNLSTLAGYLMRHLDADPNLAHKETPRRMRMLAANLRQTRYAYEELRRLQLARFLQEVHPELADKPILAIVATNTTRNGLRTMRPPTAIHAAVPPLKHPATPTPDTATSTRAMVANAARLAPTNPVRLAPGRNAACPCNSGLKYKRCCANKQQAA